MAQAILLCPDWKFIDAVSASIDRQLEGMARTHVIAASLSARGALIKVRSDGAGDSAVPGLEIHRRGQREHRSSARGYGTQARDCRLAQCTRRADQGQI